MQIRRFPHLFYLDSPAVPQILQTTNLVTLTSPVQSSSGREGSSTSAALSNVSCDFGMFH
jgi:hypothetical protein